MSLGEALAGHILWKDGCSRSNRPVALLAAPSSLESYRQETLHINTPIVEITPRLVGSRYAQLFY